MTPTDTLLSRGRPPRPGAWIRSAGPGFSAFLLLACGLVSGDETQNTGAIVGKAGEIEVGTEEISRHLAGLEESEREALRRDPSSLSQYVRAFLVQRLVLREASAAGWEKSPVVTERLAVLREGIIANTYLESIGRVPEGYPDETTLAAAYEANREALREPKSWRLAQIFISSPTTGENAGETPAALEKRDRVAAALRQADADFATLASKESDDRESGPRGGEIGWLPETRIHPAIRKVLPEMKLGEISEAVRMDDGWHFIQVLDIRESHIPTLSQVRETLVERLREDRSRAETEAFLSRLLEENPVAVDEVTVSRLLTPPSD